VRSEYVIVLTTIGAATDGAALARTLVGERLVACVNVLAPMTSVYRWKDKVEQDSEQQLVMKTTAARVDALRSRLGELHPYEVPEFLVIPIESGSPTYLSWLRDVTL
jgi:periplasmic divalent cation tolerance protein